MIELNNESRCCGCGACVAICPKNAITLEENKEGFLYPLVNESLCIQCGLCNKVCPFENDVESHVINAFAGYSNDETIHIKSSSGGIFSHIAENVINKGGVVYGVKMSEDCNEAQYCAVDQIDDLYLLRGSKYLQAKLENTFTNIKNTLDSGRLVLFSGSPCFAKGLKLFLRKKYDNLIIIDFICHGVPSPKLWRRHKTYLENKYQSGIKNVDFRFKIADSKRKDRKEKSLIINFDHDFYIQFFLRDLCLRESCYECKAKGQSVADITIADLWGAENVCPEMTNVLGTSFIIVRTKRGNNILNVISDKLKLTQISYEEAIQFNKNEIVSVKRPVGRETFYVDLDSIAYSQLYTKYLFPTKKSKIKKFLIERGVIQFMSKRNRGGELFLAIYFN